MQQNGRGSITGRFRRPSTDQLTSAEAEKVHQEKVQQEKLKEVKARLNFEGCSGRNSRIREVSQHSESRTPNVRGEHRRGRRLGGKGKSVSAHSKIRYQSSRSERTESVPRKRHHEGTCSRRMEMLSESEDSGGGHWKSKSKKQKSSIEEDDFSQQWLCDETNPFTPRIRYFELPKKTRMASNVKTYDGSDDPKDHLKNFQAAAKVECWAMPTWCHMFNSTPTGSARQKKCIKDPVEIHHIKQREGESTEDFVQRFKTESRHVKGAPECMRISGFMHGITNPELIKRLHENISNSVDEMMRVTTGFSGERWQLPTKHERKHFRHGSNKKQGENKILTGGEITEISRDQSGDVTSSHCSQNPQRKFWL
ncbi:hypothetical protein Tco_0763616 [Tanacetum coccineum]